MKTMYKGYLIIKQGTRRVNIYKNDKLINWTDSESCAKYMIDNDFI